MGTNCPFCNIVAGQLPASLIFQDDWVTVFHDIHPITPVHILIVPNKHITSVNEIEAEDEGLLGHMTFIARQIAEQEDLAHSGYRLVINTGPDAGQSVFHLHMHLIGGRRMPFRFDER